MVYAPISVTHAKNLDPRLGWLAIAAVVGGWDLINSRSLTSYARAHKLGTLIIGGVTMAHLLGALPQRLDPFEYVAGLVGRR